MNNSAGYGGALALSGLSQSKILLWSNTIMTFRGNFALHRGGAIHVEDNPFTYCIFESNLRSNFREACFFQVLEYQDCDFNNINNLIPLFDNRGIELFFEGNKADQAGNVLYGGNLELCGVCTPLYRYYVTGAVAFDRFGSISSDLTSGSDVTSDPYRVCVCEDNHPDCSENVTTCQVYPGETTYSYSCGCRWSVEWNISRYNPCCLGRT